LLPTIQFLGFTLL